jgi:hypothetical protein
VIRGVEGETERTGPEEDQGMMNDGNSKWDNEHGKRISKIWEG